MRAQRWRLAPALALALFSLTGLQAEATESDPLAPPDLRGQWVQLQTTTSLTRVPVIGDVTSRTQTLLLIDVDQEGRDLVLHTQVCQLDIENRPNMVRTQIPDAFRRSMPTTQRRARLVPTPSGWEFLQPRFTEVHGARLQNPERDALPENADDPRVWDQDRSGQPGVTVRIEGMVRGDIWLVQRGWSELRGRLTSVASIEGWISWQNEQVILGSNNRFLRRESEAVPHPDRSENTFRMSRLERRSTCAELRPEMVAAQR